MNFEDAETISALRRSLSELEELKLLIPDDVELLKLKASLRQRIAQLEEPDSEGA